MNNPSYFDAKTIALFLVFFFISQFVSYFFPSPLTVPVRPAGIDSLQVFGFPLTFMFSFGDSKTCQIIGDTMGECNTWFEFDFYNLLVNAIACYFITVLGLIIFEKAKPNR